MDTLDAGKQKPVVNEYLVFKYACYTEIIPMSASEIMPNPFDRIPVQASPLQWVGVPPDGIQRDKFNELCS
jgi:hypothetical protein